MRIDRERCSGPVRELVVDPERDEKANATHFEAARRSARIERDPAELEADRAGVARERQRPRTP